MANFQVLFSGGLIQGFEESAVKKAIAAELNIDERKCAHLFCGKTVVVRSQLNHAAALALVDRLEILGAIARVKDLTPKSSLPPDFERDRLDHTVRDLTAAHAECPRCSHMQLAVTHCGRCGVDMESAFKRLRKEDLLIEKKLRDLQAKRDATAAQGTAEVTPGTAAAIDAEIALAPDAEDAKAKAKPGKLRRWLSRSR